MKIFGAACGFAAIACIANAAEKAADSEYGTPPASTAQVAVPAGAQNITLKVRVRRPGRPAAQAQAQPSPFALSSAPRQDVVVDGNDADEERAGIYNRYAEAVPEPRDETGVGANKNLAHPFFQPSARKVAISLDADYAVTQNNFTILQDYHPLTDAQNLKGETFGWNGQRLTYKLGASFGITDTVEVKGTVAGQDSRWVYEGRRVDGTTGILDGGNIVMTESGFDSWGLGLGWRAFENEDFIFKLDSEFRAWSNSNLIYLGGLGGLKRGDSLVYLGLGGFFYNNEGNAYGFGISDEDGWKEYVLYEEDNKNPWFFEATIGLFSKFNRDFSGDFHASYADLDWHSVITVGGLLAYQPVQSFAVMVYGNYQIYDSAEGMEGLRLWSNIGNGVMEQTKFLPRSDIRLENPSQFVVGAGMKLYF
jgi:hypothetical protein